MSPLAISKISKTLLLGASGTLLIRVIGSGLIFLAQVLLAQLMGLEQYGIYAFSMVLLILGSQIGSLGFGEAATRFLAQYHETGKSALARGFLSASRKTVLLANLMVVTAIAGLVYVVPGWVEPGYLLPVLIALATIPVLAYQDMLEGKALAFSWYMLALSPRYIVRQAINLLILLVIVMEGIKLDATAAVAAMFFASAVSVIFQHFRLASEFDKKFEVVAERRYDWPAWRQMVVPLCFQQALHVAARQLDVLIIGIFLSAEYMALYFAATRLSGLLGLFQYSVKIAAVGRFAVLTGVERLSDLVELVRNTTLMIFLFTLLAFAGLVILGIPLLYMFGAEYIEAYWVLIILGLGILAHSSTGAAEDILIMNNHANATLLAQVIGMGTAGVFLFMFIPIWGIEGAAAAFSLGLAVNSLTLDCLVRRKIGISSFVMTLGQTQNRTTEPSGTSI